MLKQLFLRYALKKTPENLQLEALKKYIQQQFTADAKKMLFQDFVNKCFKKNSECILGKIDKKLLSRLADFGY